MKKILLAALFAAAPLTAFAGSAAELSDTDLGAVSGQAGLQLTAAQTQQIITGLLQHQVGPRAFSVERVTTTSPQLGPGPSAGCA